MAENVYEGMFILDSNHYARDAAATSASVEELVEKNGGELLASRLWSEQKLAYPINGHRKGAYWLTYFRMDSQRLADLNRAARLNDSVLRSLVIKIDPRLVDAMVAHALGQAESGDESGEEAGETTSEEKAAGEPAQGEKTEAAKPEPATAK